MEPINPTSFLLLSHLRIKVCQLRSEDIHVLGMLQALRSLKVKVAAAKQVVFQRFMIRADAFPFVTWCKFSGVSMVPSMFPLGAMPMLQHFKFHIRPEDFGDCEFNVDELAFGHLPSLQTVWVSISGKEEVNQEVVTKVKAALMQQARVHSNHPDIYFRLS